MATYWENSCSFGLRYGSWYKCLIVSLVFSHLGFWSGNLFLIAPFPDLCLLVPFHLVRMIPIVPVSVHSDSANGNILLLTNIVYVINKNNIVISTHLSFAIIFRLDMPENSPC